MSLDQLRDMRRTGKRPESVNVLIGKSRAYDDWAGVVQITEPPRNLDLRPLMGLRAHVIDLQNDKRLTLAVLDALQALTVQPVGFAGPAGTWGCSPDHEWAIELYREGLWLTS